MSIATWDTDFIKANSILAPSYNSVQNMVANAIAEERERCAKICDDLARENRVTRKGEGASLCADRIRKPYR